MLSREPWYREALDKDLVRLQRDLADGAVSPQEFLRQWERARPGAFPPLSVEQFLTLSEESQPKMKVGRGYSSEPINHHGDGLESPRERADEEETLTLSEFLARWERDWKWEVRGGEEYASLYTRVKPLLVFREREIDEGAWSGLEYVTEFQEQGTDEDPEDSFGESTSEGIWAYSNESWLSIQGPPATFLESLAKYVGVEYLEKW